MKEIEKRVIAVTSKILNMRDICPIIYYHDIVPDGEGFSYQKTEISLFAEQIKYIARQGIKTYTFYDLQQNPGYLNEKGLIISFDDGYLSNYTMAFPVFAKYGVKFNIFVEGRAVSAQNEEYLTEDQIRELYHSGLVGFGAHTWTHFDCLSISDSSFDTEITKENEYLCSILNVERITDFCFPYGNYDRRVLSYLDQKGVYERIYTSDNRKPESLGNSVVCGRIAIENNDTLQNFSDKINGRFGSYRLMKKIKNFVKGEKK